MPACHAVTGWTPRVPPGVTGSDEHQLPLAVAALDAHGRVVDKISVVVSACPSSPARPWNQLQGATLKDYVDLLD